MNVSIKLFSCIFDFFFFFLRNSEYVNFEGFRIVKIDFNFKVGCRWKRLEIFEIFIFILFYFILFLFLFYFYFYLFIEIR